MANENPSRDNPSRQQSAERSQTGASQQGTGAAQQGTGGAQPRTGMQGGHGQGTQGQGAYGQGSQGGYGQGSQGGYGQGSQGGYGQGSQGSYGQGSQGGYGQRAGGRYGQGSQERGQGGGNYAQGVGKSTWQGGRQSGGAVTPRSGAGLSPYYGSSGYGSGPFSVMRRISDEMDRLFENFGMGRGLFQSEPGQGEQWDVGHFDEGAAPSMWSPHIEVCERNGKLLIQADLPGMKRDDIHVRVEDDEVIIQGERRQEQSNNERGYYRSERSYGSFYRTIPLPEGTNAESANATFRDGVLEIEFDAPRQQQRGRTLEIREGGSSQSGGHAGTTSGTTYGSGTTGSMTGTSGTSGGQHLQSGTGTTQHSSGGASGTQHASGTGSGTMYSGSGNPSVGAAGMGGATPGSSSDKSSRGSNS